jgi:hypothetical protein
MRPQDLPQVLVMTDDPALLESLRRSLDGAYTLTACDSARAALALLRTGGRFDVAVCDLTEIGARDLHDRLLEVDPLLAGNLLALGGGRLSAEDEEFVDEGRLRLLPRNFGVDRLRTELHALAVRASLHRLAVGGV